MPQAGPEHSTHCTCPFSYLHLAGLLDNVSLVTVDIIPWTWKSTCLDCHPCSSRFLTITLGISLTPLPLPVSAFIELGR